MSQTATIAGSTANGTTTYTYDALDRVTGYTPPSSSGIAAHSYTWDTSPDRLSVTVGSSTTDTWFDAHQQAGDSAGGSYAYDGEGRLTLMPGKTMTYDALGRLVSVHQTGTGALIATYTYDPLDRLETVTEGGSTSSFLYVGLTSAISVVSVTGSGGTTVTKHATDLAGTELYEYNTTAMAPAFVGRDAHGDVSWTTDTTGSVTASATYDPFGNVVASTGSVPNNRWQSSRQDTTAGLYYVVARWQRGIWS